MARLTVQTERTVGDMIVDMRLTDDRLEELFDAEEAQKLYDEHLAELEHEHGGGMTTDAEIWF